MGISAVELGQVSIIIPVLNERENLPATLAAAKTAFPEAEIIIVDGGSTDGTREWLRGQAGDGRRLRALESPVRGRGPQMNAGGAAATGFILLFLHADCLLPPDAPARIAAALESSGVAGGAFCVRFAETTPRSLPVTAALINAHARLRQAATGDQAIFARRRDWEILGGYQDWPLFEDVDFVTRLKRERGRFVIVPSAVTISARRWQEFGIGKTSLLMCALWVGYHLGISPFRLKRWFTDVRPHLTPRKKP